MAIIEFQKVGVIYTTECPFRKIINVGSKACQECKYFGNKLERMRQVVCHYDIAHPDAKIEIEQVGKVRWRKCKAGYKFPCDAIVIPDDDRTTDRDPRLVRCAVWDSRYILIDDLKKLPVKDE